MTANEAAEVFTWISSCVFVKKTGEKKARGTLRVSEDCRLVLERGKSASCCAGMCKVHKLKEYPGHISSCWKQTTELQFLINCSDQTEIIYFPSAWVKVEGNRMR